MSKPTSPLSRALMVLIALLLSAAPALADKAPPPRPKTTEGDITSRKGKTFVIKMDPAQTRMPWTGDRGECSKKFQQGPFSGWLVIAEVEVTKIDGGDLTLKILEEKSVTKVDGKKVDHFTKDTHVKIDWAR